MGGKLGCAGVAARLPTLRPGPAHGHAIAKIIERGSGDELQVEQGSLYPALHRLIKRRWIAAEEGVASDVRFVGQRPRNELRYFYSAADVFVTMPWYEPFGITPVEAMACGIPVVGARVGGIQYSVEDGRTGFLVEAKNADALARRLAHVFSDPSIRRLLGKRARRRAWERFTWQQVSRSLADLYAEVATTASESRAAVAQGTR